MLLRQLLTCKTTQGFITRDLHSVNVALSENHMKKAFNCIPGPKPLPLIGNIWRYFPIIGEYKINKMDSNGEYNLRKYGPLVREVIHSNHCILHVFDPKDIEAVFRQEGRYPYRRSHRALLKYRKDLPDVYNSGGLFSENGSEWARLRKAFQTLLNQHTVNKYINDCQRITLELIDFIKQTRDSSGEVIDFQEHLYKWALENTAVLTLDSRLGCLDANLKDESDVKKLIKASHDTQEAVMRTEMAKTESWESKESKDYKLLLEAQNSMTAILEKYFIKKLKILTQNNDGDKSMLSQFLKQPDIDNKDIFAVIVDFFLAGIDTTAFTAGFVFYFLSRNVDIQERLRTEINSILKNDSTLLSPDKLAQMQFLKACVKETMRLRPISIGVGRVATKDMVIRGYSVPEGTMIITQNQVSCRQEKYFQDPHLFIPDRWMKSKENCAKPSPFLVLPFGYGPRMCIGRRFSEMELYVLVAMIIKHFKVEYHYSDIGVMTRLINVPDKQMRYRFIDT